MLFRSDVTTTVPTGPNFPTITAFNGTGNLGVGSFSTFVYVQTNSFTANGVYLVRSLASGDGLFIPLQIPITVGAVYLTSPFQPIRTHSSYRIRSTALFSTHP